MWITGDASSTSHTTLSLCEAGREEVVRARLASYHEAIAAARGEETRNVESDLTSMPQSLTASLRVTAPYTSWRRLIDELPVAFQRIHPFAGIGYATTTTDPLAQLQPLRAAARPLRGRVAVSAITEAARGLSAEYLLDAADSPATQAMAQRLGGVWDPHGTLWHSQDNAALSPSGAQHGP